MMHTILKNEHAEGNIRKMYMRWRPLPLEQYSLFRYPALPQFPFRLFTRKNDERSDEQSCCVRALSLQETIAHYRYNLAAVLTERQ